MAGDDLPDPGPDPAATGWGRPLVLAGLAAGLAGFLLFGPDRAAVEAWAGGWRGHAREHLLVAAAVFFAAEVALVAVSAPVGFWLTVLAGFLFGAWVAVPVVSFASAAGAVLAFLASRYLFADALRRVAARRPWLARRLAATDRGVRGHGAFYLILLRLTPLIPFWLINLGMGLTPMQVRTFWWASQVGMLPMTVLAATLGAGVSELRLDRNLLTLELAAGLTLMAVVPLGLHLAARRVLRRWG